MNDYRKRLDEINALIKTIDPKTAIDLLGSDDVCFVDLRDGYELDEYGQIPGAKHCPRGSLEVRIPSDSPFHRDYFGHFKRFVLYCSHGERSVFATRTAQELGLEDVCHIRGGMIAWGKAGGDIVAVKKDVDK